MEGGSGTSVPPASATTSTRASEKEGSIQNAGNNSTSETNSSSEVTYTDESDADYVSGIGRTKHARKRKHRMQNTERWKRRRIPKVKRRQCEIHDEDKKGSTFPVHCGKVKGVLYKKEFAKGIFQKSIKSSDGKWFTPPEFEVEGGRASWKCWKRSIYYKLFPLGELIKSGYLPNPRRKYGKKRKQVESPSVSFGKSAQIQSSAVACHDGPEEGIPGPSEEATPAAPEEATPAPSEETTPVAPQTSGMTQTKLLKVKLTRLSPSDLTRARCSPLDSPWVSPPDSPWASPPDSPQVSPLPVPRRPHQRSHCRRSMKPHTMSSSLGFAILHSVRKMERLFQNTFGNCRALQEKLQDISDHLTGLGEQHADLKKALDRCRQLDGALDVLALQKQVDGIILHQRKLKILVEKILKTLGADGFHLPSLPL